MTLTSADVAADVDPADGVLGADETGEDGAVAPLDAPVVAVSEALVPGLPALSLPPAQAPATSSEVRARGLRTRRRRVDVTGMAVPFGRVLGCGQVGSGATRSGARHGWQPRSTRPGRRRWAQGSRTGEGCSRRFRRVRFTARPNNSATTAAAATPAAGACIDVPLWRSVGVGRAAAALLDGALEVSGDADPATVKARLPVTGCPSAETTR